MGVLKLFSSGSNPQPGNPDPRRFTVKRAMGYGDYWVRLWLNYPDCTNYGGDKILVYEGYHHKELRPGPLDPHFIESGISSIARFEPTERGWEMSFYFLQGLAKAVERRHYTPKELQ